MATITTSIGTNSSLDTQTPSSGTGANPYTVTFGTDPTGVSVGDSVQFDNGMGTVYQYLVTEISGSDYTLKWITGGGFATNPYGIVDMSYSQAAGVFKRTYSTISAWESDLDNTDYYSSSDDAVGEVYNDSVFDEYIVIDSGGTVGLSSVTLTVPESERHDGTAGTGARVEYTGSQSSSFRIRRSQCTVEWLELDLTSTAAAVSAGLNLGTNSTQEVYARNNIIHGLTTQSTHIHGVYVWGTGDSSNSRHVMNNLVYRIDNSSTTKEASGITVAGSNWGVYLYNNTVYYVKATGGGDNAFCFSINDTDTVIKNNIAARPLALYSYWQKCFGESGFAGSTHDYNLSTDSTATGTNSVTGEAYGDLFVSDTGGTEDLHLKAGADAIGAGVDLGTSPTGVNIDIDGRDRDAEGDTWDIGADQYVVFVLSVDPSPATVIASTADPSVLLGSISVTPAAASALASTADPSVHVSALVVTPTAATCIAQTEAPTVLLGSVTTSPSAASALASTVDPSVLLSSITVTPSEASAITSTVDPSVLLGSVTTSPSAASALASTADPSVVLGSITITPTAAGAVAQSIDPTVTTVQPALTPGHAGAVAATVDPTVITTDPAITPEHAGAVAATVDPTVATLLKVIPTPSSSVVSSAAPVCILGSVTVTPTAGAALVSTADPVVLQASVTITAGAASAVAQTIDPTTLQASITLSAQAEAVAATADPAVIFGSVTATPTAGSVIAQTADPSLIFSSISVTPTASAAVGQSVLGAAHQASLALTAAASDANAASVDPSVTLGSLTLSDLQAEAVADTADPVLATGRWIIKPPAIRIRIATVIGSASTAAAAAAGLEYTMPSGLLDYGTRELLELTLPLNRMHYTIEPSQMHATLPANHIHYQLVED